MSFEMVNVRRLIACNHNKGMHRSIGSILSSGQQSVFNYVTLWRMVGKISGCLEPWFRAPISFGLTPAFRPVRNGDEVKQAGVSSGARFASRSNFLASDCQQIELTPLLAAETKSNDFVSTCKSLNV